MAPPKPVYSYLAAACLAAVTLFTFYVFRGFGPQSVLRQFHIDVARRDEAHLRTLIADPDSPYSAQMVRIVSNLISYNATFEIVALKRQGDMMLVFVEYRVAGTVNVIVWHVRQTDTDWKVDCKATWQGFRTPVELMR